MTDWVNMTMGMVVGVGTGAVTVGATEEEDFLRR